MTKTTKTLILSMTLATILFMMPITATATVSPISHSDTIPSSGGTTSVTKTVTTGAIPANPDIYFLTDTTGSMGGTIASVKAEMGNILTSISGSEPTAQFAVGEYRDFGDAFVHRTTQILTSSQVAAQTAINGLVHGGGGDLPEAQLFGLTNVATDGTIGFRTGSSNIIVWFGDQPGHDPSGGATLGSTTTALVNGGFTVIAINTGNLDGTGQATHITSNTGGSLTTVAAGNAGLAVLNAIQQLTTTITPSATCNGGLSASFIPSSHTGVGGSSSVQFAETVTVPSGTAPGTYQCSVDFTDSAGASLGTQTVTITVPNDPPTAVDDSVMLDEDTSVNLDPKTNDSDPNGDPLTISSVGTASHGTVVIELDNTVTYTPDADYNGPDSFTYTIADGRGGTDSATVNVTVKPVNDAPVCGDATGDTSLWPPNHKMVSLDVDIAATDVDGDVLTIGVTSIFQDEPTNGLGDGDISPDGEIAVDGTAQVRSERSGLEDGRVYVLTVTASDGELSCSNTVEVGVPHDKKDTAVNSGATFDSTTP